MITSDFDNLNEVDFLQKFGHEYLPNSSQRKGTTKMPNNDKKPSVFKKKLIRKMSEDTTQVQTKTRKKRIFRGFWSREQDVQYNIGVLKFAMTHKFHNISWGTWKPGGFYTFLEDHLISIFGSQRAKDADQCKTKDMSLKRTYFSNSENPLDLLDVALNTIQQYVQNLQKKQEESTELTQEQQQCLARCQMALSQFKSKKDEIPVKPSFVDQFEKLMAYSRSTKGLIRSLLK